jgi:hypothetical protein
MVWCALRCRGSGKRRLFTFPRDVLRRQKWIEACNRSPGWTPSTSARLCEVSIFKQCAGYYYTGQKKRLELCKVVDQ